MSAENIGYTLGNALFYAEITTVDSDHPFLSFDVAGLLTRVRIWHSHPRWPETVTIGLG
jgi:hypothetical protein